MKYCLDCRHFVPRHPYYPFDLCAHPEARNPIGRLEPPNRIEYGKCGPDGLLWEAKPPEPPSIWKRLRIAINASAQHTGEAT